MADVVSFGGLVKTYEVQPDLPRMRHLKISLQQLVAALGRSNANAGGGYVEHGRQQFLIRGIGLLRSAAGDVENVVVVIRSSDIRNGLLRAIVRRLTAYFERDRAWHETHPDGSSGHS